MTPRSWRGPRAWGLLLLGLAIAVLAALFLARTLIRPDVELAERAAREQRSTDWAPPALVVVALLGYALLMEPIGYVVATTLFFPVVARVLGSRAPARDVIAGLVLGAVLYVAFTQFLGVDLPAGLTPIT